jgi:hypothetical protein
MTIATRRFILRVIVGLVTFLIGVAVAMAFAGFRPFESNQSGQRNYRHYRYKKSCNYQFRSWNVPPPTPVPPMPSAHANGSYPSVGHLKGPDGITVTVEK